MLGEAKGDPEGRSWTLGVLTPARLRANHRTGPLRCLCLLRRSTSIRNTFQTPPSYTGGKLSVGCAGGNRLQRTRTANSMRFPRPKSWVGTPAARAVPAQPGSSVVQTRNSPRGPAAPQPRFLRPAPSPASLPPLPSFPWPWTRSGAGTQLGSDGSRWDLRCVQLGHLAKVCSEDPALPRALPHGPS